MKSTNCPKDIKYMVTVLKYQRYWAKVKNVIEGEARRAIYHVFGPSPNIDDISRCPFILFIQQL